MSFKFFVLLPIGRFHRSRMPIERFLTSTTCWMLSISPMLMPRASHSQSVASRSRLVHSYTHGAAQVRTVFVIDPKKIIRLTISYPAQVGRSFDEILRAVDSLQLGDKHKITTPVNWKKGDDVIVHPAVNDEQANTLFPGYVKHLVCVPLVFVPSIYLRPYFTAVPSNDRYAFLVPCVCSRFQCSCCIPVP